MNLSDKKCSACDLGFAPGFYPHQLLPYVKKFRDWPQYVVKYTLQGEVCYSHIKCLPLCCICHQQPSDDYFSVPPVGAEELEVFHQSPISLSNIVKRIRAGPDYNLSTNIIVTSRNDSLHWPNPLLLAPQQVCSVCVRKDEEIFLKEKRIKQEEEKEAARIKQEAIDEKARIKQEEEKEAARIKREEEKEKERIKQEAIDEKARIKQEEEKEAARIKQEEEKEAVRILQEEERIKREKEKEAARIKQEEEKEAARIKKEKWLEAARIKREDEKKAIEALISRNEERESLVAAKVLTELIESYVLGVFPKSILLLVDKLFGKTEKKDVVEILLSFLHSGSENKSSPNWSDTPYWKEQINFLFSLYGMSEKNNIPLNNIISVVVGNVNQSETNIRETLRIAEIAAQQIKESSKTNKDQRIGEVEDIYPTLNVVTIKLTRDLAIGDRIAFKRANNFRKEPYLEVTINSLQINNLPVQQATAGFSVGVRIDSTTGFKKVNVRDVVFQEEFSSQPSEPSQLASKAKLRTNVFTSTSWNQFGEDSFARSANLEKWLGNLETECLFDGIFSDHSKLTYDEALELLERGFDKQPEALLEVVSGAHWEVVASRYGFYQI